MWPRNSRNKLGNQKTSMDGYSFSSKLEASVYGLLKLRAMAGEIKIVQVQDHQKLSDAEIIYVPDFKCINLKNGIIFWVEAKGHETERWPTIKKLWRIYGPGPLEIWKGSWETPYLKELILPRERKTQRYVCKKCGEPQYA